MLRNEFYLPESLKIKYWFTLRNINYDKRGDMNLLTRSDATAFMVSFCGRKALLRQAAAASDLLERTDKHIRCKRRMRYTRSSMNQASFMMTGANRDYIDSAQALPNERATYDTPAPSSERFDKIWNVYNIKLVEREEILAQEIEANSFRNEIVQRTLRSMRDRVVNKAANSPAPAAQDMMQDREIRVHDELDQAFEYCISLT